MSESPKSHQATLAKFAGADMSPEAQAETMRAVEALQEEMKNTQESELVQNGSFPANTDGWNAGEMTQEQITALNRTWAEQMAADIRQRQVEESKRQHEAFVKKHMGVEYEPKFSNVNQDETYFISFLRTKKTANVTIPPIMMAGQNVEHLMHGRMYACSGGEARLAERVLATKRIEILNLTPKREGLNATMQLIIQQWHYLTKTPEERAIERMVKEARQPFANYTEEATMTTDPNVVDVEAKEVVEVEERPVMAWATGAEDVDMPQPDSKIWLGDNPPSSYADDEPPSPV